ncbi:hypothetical protein [Kribbella swartbergensis]
MTTPHQGAGLWEQGNMGQALGWLADRSPEEQLALKKLIDKQLAPPGRIMSVVLRVQQIYRQTSERLSERAQQLASQARQFGQSTAARAGQVVQNTTNRVNELGQQAVGAYQTGRDATVEAAAAAYQRGRETAADLAQRGAVAADLAAQVAAERVQAAGRAVAEGAQTAGRAVVDGAQTAGRAVAEGAQNTGRAVVAGAQTAGRAVAEGTQNAGHAVAEAGRQAYTRASRWFQQKVSNGAARANAARAAYAQFRQDPTLNQSSITPKDIAALSARAHAIATEQDPQARLAALAEYQKLAERYEPINTSTSDKRNENLAAWINQGQTPATGAVSLQKPQQQNQGQSPQTGPQSPTRAPKPPEKGL